MSRKLRRGNLRVPDAGLGPGERIVVNGLMCARRYDTIKPHLVDMADAAKPAASQARGSS
ncbi:hypothetical protein J8I87_10560 [Paraburkholderia sp. LEh10]|uniref:hypothetical protein n=1 Tax=Paraburkholderia sp. LEh10 TaxID=2821353 RepID=UPI001AE4CB8D|nr:hypothetical protein [Paraburkholderia sp. LEh10]MBP0590152.1 hypothetical protein [Paraburkholderia sp. LEh10]